MWWRMYYGCNGYYDLRKVQAWPLTAALVESMGYHTAVLHNEPTPLEV